VRGTIDESMRGFIAAMDLCSGDSKCGHVGRRGDRNGDSFCTAAPFSFCTAAPSFDSGRVGYADCRRIGDGSDQAVLRDELSAHLLDNGVTRGVSVRSGDRGNSGEPVFLEETGENRGLM
jgi:hypothetical protein